MRSLPRFLALFLLAALFATGAAHAQPDPQLALLGTYETNIFDEGAAEIAAFDPVTGRLFFVNADANEVVALGISDPASPQEAARLSLADLGADPGGSANTVAAAGGLVAVAVAAEDEQAPGQVVFFDSDTFGEDILEAVPVGALPDGMAFTPDGQTLVVANEGEPSEDYTVDPEGSVSLIDVSSFAETRVGFTAFNGQEAALEAEGIRIFGPGASVAEDLEPEYVAISPDGATAYVSIQENNAIAIIDLATATVTELAGLGFKDHSQSGQGFDASNEDGGINIETWPVLGMYQPDALAAFAVGGQTYVVTANEGDGRDYDGFSEEADVADLNLDPTAYPDAATLQLEENLGALTSTTATGDADGDGDIDQIYAFGARSFSILEATGGGLSLIYDSGDDLEQRTAEAYPDNFNADNDENQSFDSRSDNKGPEPEAVTVGVVDGTPYAFVGLERIGGVAVYDVSSPASPRFVQYVNNRDFSVEDVEASVEGDGAVGDLGPESIVFIPASEAPSGQNLVAVANEVSGTVSFFSFAPEDDGDDTFQLQLLHASDLEAGVPALDDAPRFSAVVNALRPEFANTLLLSSGDNYIPGPFFDAGSEEALAPFVGVPSDGRADIAIMNAIGFDASAIGNHEFDRGPDVVASLIGPDGAYPGTQFPYLSANLRFEEESPLAPFVVEPAGAPEPNSITRSVIFERGGEQIGVVGATTPRLPIITSPGEGTTVLPPDADDLMALADLIQAEVDALTAEGVNKVILVSHLQQFSIEEQLAGLLEGVDLIVAGGSDRLLADATDRLRTGDEAEGPYPVMETSADGNPVLLVSTAGQYEYVGRLVVEFTEEGVVLPMSVDEDVSGAYAADDQGVDDVDGEPDETVVNITDAIRGVLEERLSNTFGETAVFLNGIRNDVRTQETNLGDLTADANLAIARDADESVVLSIKNGGGIRDFIGAFDPDTGEPIPPPATQFYDEGSVSQLAIENALRFNNGLSLLTLTAEQLLAALENGVSEVEDIGGRFPQIAGVRFSFDPDRPAGERVVTVAVVGEDEEVDDVVAQDGEVVGDPERTFRIVTLSFLADGGDGYEVFTEATNRVDLEEEEATGDARFAPDGTEQDALAEYLLANFPDGDPYAMADTPREEDERIQNLNFRDDDVIDGDGADATPPVCGEIVVDRDGEPPSITTSATDEESGIASITFTRLKNLDGFYALDGEDEAGGFAQGDAVTFDAEEVEAVEFGGTLADASQRRVAIVVTVENGAGLTAECDPVVSQVDAAVPTAFALEGNYPNPVRSGTTIRFAVAEKSAVTLEVYDVLGRRVASLVDEEMSPGSYTVRWAAGGLPSGTYVYRMRAGSFAESRTLTLVR